MRNSENFKNFLSDNVSPLYPLSSFQGIRMNYESEALIFYHDKPEENIFNLSCFLQKRLYNNHIGAKSNFYFLIFNS